MSIRLGIMGALLSWLADTAIHLVSHLALIVTLVISLRPRAVVYMI